MFPYIDLSGIMLRSVLRPSYFSDVEKQTPGFVAQSIASNSSSINSRLRKRYGGILPWGQSVPALVPAGTLPPLVTLSGRPTLGSFLIIIQITSGGPLGPSVFQWSSNGGLQWVTGVNTAASVSLTGTGMTALFPVGTYSTDNVYSAAPPVPETILKWVTWLVTEDVSTRHGINPNDPLSVRISEKAKLAEAQLEEAANTQTGLFDLPTSEDEASAIDTGGPMSYSEASPYAWTYAQQRASHRPHISAGLGGSQSVCPACASWPCSCRNGLVGS